jgi:hypothetical protein
LRLSHHKRIVTADNFTELFVFTSFKVVYGINANDSEYPLEQINVVMHIFWLMLEKCSN